MTSIPERLKRLSSKLTNSERKVASVLLENHPLSGLGGIISLAEKSGVSTPTITRLVDKLGFKGYSEFQSALRSELDDKMSKEILGGEPWAHNVADEHVLNGITDAVMMNVRETLADIDVHTLDAVCALLSELDRNIFIAGGRITSSIADHLHKYLQVLRPDTQLIGNVKNSWYHSMMDMKKGDILFVYDIRRYETELLRMANVANELGAEIILITDQLRSPIYEIASHTICGRIVMPNSRSSLVSHLLLNEVIVFQMQNILGDVAKERWESLESVFKSGKYFTK